MTRIENASASESWTEAEQCGFRLRTIRTDEALARFTGDEARLRHWLLDFRTYGAELTAQIAEAIASASPETAISRTHALKGRAGMLGMSEVYAIAQALEIALMSGEDTALRLDQIERAVLETCAEITGVLGKAA